MLRKIVLALMAAASFGVALAGVSTPASAEHWDGPRYGYGGGYGPGHGYGYGPPPWVVRRWHRKRYHHYDHPAYQARLPRHLQARPVRPHW